MKHDFNSDLLLLDLETTGSDPNRHEIVEIGAILLDCGTLDEKAAFESRVRPTHFERADPTALRIHGLTEQDLEYAPSSDEVLSAFVKTFGLNYALCGWNIGFDTAFLRQYFDQAGRIEEFNQLDYHRLDLWSALQLSWVSGKFPVEPRSLTDVCSWLGINRRQKHNALEDARIAAQVLRHIVG